MKLKGSGRPNPRRVRAAGAAGSKRKKSSATEARAAPARTSQRRRAKPAPEPGQHQQALRSERLERRALFEMAPVGIAILRKGTVLKCNARLEEMIGYGAGELIGKPIWVGYADKREWRRVAPEVEARIRSGGIVHFEVEAKNKNGRRFWVMVDGRALDLQHPGDTAVFVISDINEHRQTVARLRESEERFRSLSALSADWYWEQDEQFRFTMESEAATSAVGTLFTKRIGQTRWDIPSIGVSEAAWAEHKALLRAHCPFRDFELGRAVRYDREVWVSVSGLPKFDERGKFCGYRGVTRDITVRKAAEQLLKVQAERLRMTQSLAGMVSAEWDIKANTMTWSGPRDWLLGTLPSSGSYPPFRELVHPDDRERILAARAAALQDVEDHEADFRIVRTDGEMRWIASRGKVFFGAGGQAERMLVVLQDITERKRAEAEVQKLNAELETRIAALELANGEMESFTYSVSHDLRAPLRALDGFARLLVSDYQASLDEGARGFLRRISANAERMGCLIDDLLNLSRTMRAKMDYREVDLSRIAMEAAAELRESNPGRDIDLVLVPRAPARGDPSLLRIVLQNLLDNAWKFTQRHAHARIEFGVGKDDKARTFYFVRDDGAGFDMAYSDKLFGPFQRLHRVDEFPGTGIGLATVQRIVSRHGGRVWAEAAVEKGATFCFTLGRD